VRRRAALLPGDGRDLKVADRLRRTRRAGHPPRPCRSNSTRHHPGPAVPDAIGARYLGAVDPDDWIESTPCDPKSTPSCWRPHPPDQASRSDERRREGHVLYPKMDEDPVLLKDNIDTKNCRPGRVPERCSGQLDRRTRRVANCERAERSSLVRQPVRRGQLLARPPLHIGWSARRKTTLPSAGTETRGLVVRGRRWVAGETMARSQIGTDTRLERVCPVARTATSNQAEPRRRSAESACCRSRTSRTRGPSGRTSSTWALTLGAGRSVGRRT